MYLIAEDRNYVCSLDRYTIKKVDCDCDTFSTYGILAIRGKEFCYLFSDNSEKHRDIEFDAFVEALTNGADYFIFGEQE